MSPRSIGSSILLAFAMTLSACVSAPAPQRFDIVLSGGEVVDGTGSARYRADVGIVGDRIAAIGDLSRASAGRVVNVSGRVVTPGFIDLHAHLVDAEAGAAGLLSEDPRRRAAQNYVAQGVTTALGNPDGAQPASLHEEREALRSKGIGLNIALTNGHNGLRAIVMGADQRRPANADEIRRMREILEHDLANEGSFGLSLSTEYFSGRYASLEEQVELARALPAYDGIFIPHLRSQGIAPMWYQPSVDRGVTPPTLDNSIGEVLHVARETGATVVFTHMKAWGPGYRGNAQRLVDRVQAARAQGSRIYMDVYPFSSSGSDGTFVALPTWAFGANPGSDYTAALVRTMRGMSAARRADLERDILHNIRLKGGAENLLVLAHPNSAYVGKRFSELMASRRLNEVEMALTLQREGDPSLPGGARIRAFSMAEEDIETFYRQDWAATSTDGWVVLPEEAVGDQKYVRTNRRVFGSFPRRIAHYALERRVDTFEQAIRSMTSLPASILGLQDRGRLAVGMMADVAVLDLSTLRDNTTDVEPSVYPSGVDYVLVNGQFAVDGGRRTLALAGRVLDRPRRSRDSRR